jgi:DNA invertase Pin-like site-specific DNA recombinase
MTKTFAYLRVSGKGQVDGDGFTRQQQAIEQYASRYGLEIVNIFRDEGISGTNELDDRPGLSALFNALNGVRTILVERADRLARDLIVGEVLLGQCRQLGITVIEVEGGSDLTVEDGEPTKVLIRQVLGAVHQFEKSCLVRKLRAARDRQRRKHGRCEGRKPFGTKPGEDATLARMRQLRTGGATLNQIADRLNDEKLPSRTGAPWSKQAVSVILARELLG